MSHHPDRADAGELLLHPLALTALVAWFVNDHVLKVHAPGIVSGKLSDVASLVFFPLLASACAELAWPGKALALRRSYVCVFSLCTAGVMAAINTVPAAAHAYQWGLGAAQWPFHAAIAALRGTPQPGLRHVVLTMDATDLWTLPAALAPLWTTTRADRR